MRIKNTLQYNFDWDPEKAINNWKNNNIWRRTNERRI
jgi:hypothetical protein